MKLFLFCLIVIAFVACNSTDSHPLQPRACEPIEGRPLYHSGEVFNEREYVTVIDSTDNASQRPGILRDVCEQINRELDEDQYKNYPYLAEDLLSTDAASKEFIKRLLHTFTLYIEEYINTDCEYHVRISIAKILTE